jgi:hypothetical protein
LPSSDTLTAWGLSPADSNLIIPTDELGISPDDNLFGPNDNLFGPNDGSAPVIDPGISHVSYDLTDPNSLPAIGNDDTTFLSLNGGSGENSPFANLGEDSTQSALDFWS